LYEFTEKKFCKIGKFYILPENVVFADFEANSTRGPMIVFRKN